MFIFNNKNKELKKEIEKLEFEKQSRFMAFEECMNRSMRFSSPDQAVMRYAYMKQAIEFSNEAFQIDDRIWELKKSINPRLCV